MASTDIIKTSQLAVFINTSSTSTATWSRIRKQSELNLSYEIETEEEKYVDEDSPTTESTGIKVSTEGEYTAYKGDEVFDFLDGKRIARATGTDAMTQVLVVYKYKSTGSGSSTTYEAELNDATLTYTQFGGEGGGGKAKLNYSLAFNGTPTFGTVVITDGSPVFTPAS